jgi:hypothetical protein
MGKAKIETRAAELVAGGRAKLEPLFRVTRPPDGMKTIRFANLGMERAWEMGSACGSSAIVPILWLGSCVMVARIPCCFDFCVVVVDQQTRSVNMQTSTWQRLRSSASHCIASAAVWQRWSVTCLLIVETISYHCMTASLCLRGLHSIGRQD